MRRDDPTGCADFRTRCKDAGFRIWVSYASEGNRCNWIATRRDLSARVCECNSDKPGIQVVIRPFEYVFPDHTHTGAEIDVTGEFNGEWYALKAYGIGLDEMLSKADDLQRRLVAAWNHLEAA